MRITWDPDGGGVQGEGDQGGEEVGLGLYLELTAAGLDKAGGNGQAQPAAAVGTALVPRTKRWV